MKKQEKSKRLPQKRSREERISLLPVLSMVWAVVVSPGDVVVDSAVVAFAAVAVAGTGDRSA
jgi:hypothetical protein